jgi:hypothetical protein
MYHILPYTKEKALQLGVLVKPSTRKNKKIDVFSKSNEYIASIGALGFGDYPTFQKLSGKEFADKKRILYKKRHQKDRIIKFSNGWYADNLLW